MDGSGDGSRDGMGKGARDGTADNTRDGPVDDTLGASTDTARDEGADDEGDMDKRDEMTWNPNLVSFIDSFLPEHVVGIAAFVPILQQCQAHGHGASFSLDTSE